MIVNLLHAGQPKRSTAADAMSVKEHRAGSKRSNRMVRNLQQEKVKNDVKGLTPRHNQRMVW
jgi:hypothetical protein